MFYYIRTQKEASYELSEPYSTFSEARHKLENMHKKNREKSKIIEIPEIRNGLNLFVGQGYYKTIIGEGKSLYFLSDLTNPGDTIPDPFDKQRLLQKFVEEKLTPIESYCEGIEFHNVQDFDIEDILEGVDFDKEDKIS